MFTIDSFCWFIGTLTGTLSEMLNELDYKKGLWWVPWQGRNVSQTRQPLLYYCLIRTIIWRSFWCKTISHRAFFGIVLRWVDISLEISILARLCCRDLQPDVLSLFQDFCAATRRPDRKSESHWSHLFKFNTSIISTQTSCSPWHSPVQKKIQWNLFTTIFKPEEWALSCWMIPVYAFQRWRSTLGIGRLSLKRRSEAWLTEAKNLETKLVFFGQSFIYGTFLLFMRRSLIWYIFIQCMPRSIIFISYFNIS